MDLCPRSARLLVNPAARRAARLDPVAGVDRLREWGIEAAIVEPPSPEGMAVAARAAADDGVELLLVAGGDGTLRVAAGAIAGSPTALAALPTGTANVWARETGIPTDWRRAIDAHVLGRRLSIDLGRANGAPFLLMAGIGWDAAIAARVRPGLKQRIGPVAYAVEALASLRRLRPAHVDLLLDGAPAGGDWGMVVVSNTRLYGGLVQFTPNALADDGYLDVVAIGPRRRGEGIAAAVRLLAHRLAGSRSTTSARVRTAAVQTPGLPLQLDGDPLGETPVTISVQPKALVVSLPPGPLPPIFRGTTENHPKG